MFTPYFLQGSFQNHLFDQRLFLLDEH